MGRFPEKPQYFERIRWEGNQWNHVSCYRQTNPQRVAETSRQYATSKFTIVSLSTNRMRFTCTLVVRRLCTRRCSKSHWEPTTKNQVLHRRNRSAKSSWRQKTSKFLSRDHQYYSLAATSIPTDTPLITWKKITPQAWIQAMFQCPCFKVCSFLGAHTKLWNKSMTLIIERMNEVFRCSNQVISHRYKKYYYEYCCSMRWSSAIVAKKYPGRGFNILQELIPLSPSYWMACLIVSYKVLFFASTH